MTLDKTNPLESRTKEIPPLLISCVGAYDDSGFGTGGLVLHHEGQNLVIDYLDCTGLFFFDNVYYRFIRSLKILVGYNESGICYTCKFPMIKDCHDILLKDDEVVFVSTNSNELIICDFKGKLKQTIKLDGQGDAWHLNCLEVYKNELFITAFGKFNSHREWNELGCFEKGILYNLNSNETILDGLSGPHHPRYFDGKWFICDSHKSALRVYHSKNEYDTIELGGFTRGFCYDDKQLFIGMNANRKTSKNLVSKITILNRKELSEEGSIEIPFSEIYDILICKESFASAIQKNPDAFKLYTNDRIVESLRKQVEIGETTNRKLIAKASRKPKKTIIKKIQKKFWK